MSLTHKQRLFVEYYIQHWNATKAAEYAGYKGNYNTISTTGHENLQKPAVKKAIQEHIDKNNKKGIFPIDPNVKTSLIEIFGEEKTACKAIERVCLKLINKYDKINIVADLLRSSLTQTSKYAVLHRANFKCQSCGEKPHPSNEVVLHVDHIVPVSMGGSNDEENLQCLCSDCNLSKGNRFIFDHNIDQQLNLFGGTEE